MDEESEFLIDNLILASMTKGVINVELKLLGNIHEIDTPEWKETQNRYNEISSDVNKMRKKSLQRLENGTAER